MTETYPVMTYLELATEMSILGYTIEEIEIKINKETDAASRTILENEKTDLEKQLNYYLKMFNEHIYVDDDEDDDEDDDVMTNARGAIEACYDV